MSAQWWEEYSCGCVSPLVERRKDLCGYCPVHGGDRRALYKGGAPKDKATADIHRRFLEQCRSKTKVS